MLSNLDIIRLAAASPKFAQLVKTAEGFDESVPGNQAPTDPRMSQAGAYPSNQAGPQQQQNMPPQEEVMEDEYAAVPEEEMGMEEPMEDPGVAAAQSFLSPVFDAAMSGDPNAQAIIAQAAAQMANSASMAASQQMQPGMEGQMQPDMEGQDPEMQQQQPAMMTPEEEIANQIVQPQPSPRSAQEGEEGEGSDSEEGGEKKKNGEENGKKKPFPFKK